MAFDIEFEPLTINELPDFAAQRKKDGWRFVQILAATTDEGIDLIYSFMKDGLLVNHKIKDVQKNDVVPSISDSFLEAFVFENEIHELFGVQIEGIAIDFQGEFYGVAVDEPMTVITPEQKAAREKARKAEAAKAAKEAAAKAQAEGQGSAAQADAAPADKAAADAALEEKLAGMDPEKAAKLRAAMEAKAKREAAQTAGKEGE